MRKVFPLHISWSILQAALVSAGSSLRSGFWLHPTRDMEAETNWISEVANTGYGVRLIGCLK
jgi:hypothetical protein